MSVLVWGSKGFANHLGYVLQECPFCRNASPFAVYDIGRKFTIYWIPTFSYDRKLVAECGVCRGSFEVAESCREKLSTALLSQEQLSELLSGKTPARSRQRYDREEPEGPSVQVVEPGRSKPTQPVSSAEDDLTLREEFQKPTDSPIDLATEGIRSSTPDGQFAPSEKAELPANVQIPKPSLTPSSLTQFEQSDRTDSKNRRSQPTWATLAFSVIGSFLLAFMTYAMIWEPTTSVLGSSDSVEQKIADVHAYETQQQLTESQQRRSDDTLKQRQESHSLFELGNDHWDRKSYAQAMEFYEKAIQLDPTYHRPKSNLARVLSTCPEAEFRDGKRAIVLALESYETQPHPSWRVTSVVAAAFAEAGDFKTAVDWARLALSQCEDKDAFIMRRIIQQLESNLPCRW